MAISLGASAQSLLIVHSGWFVQRATHRFGSELILSLLGTGDCLGLPELILSVPAETEVVAGADCAVLSVPWRVVNALMLTAPELHVAIERELSREVMVLRSRLTSLAFSSLEGRLAAFLMEIERIAHRTPAFRVTQTMVAEAVGASRPKINRCLKALERRGVIALHNGSLPEIRDREALIDLL